MAKTKRVGKSGPSTSPAKSKKFSDEVKGDLFLERSFRRLARIRRICVKVPDRGDLSHRVRKARVHALKRSALEVSGLIQAYCSTVSCEKFENQFKSRTKGYDNAL